MATFHFKFVLSLCVIQIVPAYTFRHISFKNCLAEHCLFCGGLKLFMI
jgi:hypothetical protein